MYSDKLLEERDLAAMLISSQLTSHETQIVSSAANHPCLLLLQRGFSAHQSPAPRYCVLWLPFPGHRALHSCNTTQVQLKQCKCRRCLWRKRVGTNAREDARQIPALIACVLAIISFVRAGLSFCMEKPFVPALISDAAFSLVICYQIAVTAISLRRLSLPALITNCMSTHLPSPV